jgi:hypothetical protein
MRAIPQRRQTPHIPAVYFMISKAPDPALLELPRLDSGCACAPATSTHRTCHPGELLPERGARGGLAPAGCLGQLTSPSQQRCMAGNPAGGNRAERVSLLPAPVCECLGGIGLIPVARGRHRCEPREPARGAARSRLRRARRSGHALDACIYPHHGSSAGGTVPVHHASG